jgi:RNA polymerase sigma factor (sigma-70 family)
MPTLTFLANQCRSAIADNDFATADRIWQDYLYPHLKKAFGGMAWKWSSNTADQEDLIQEAVTDTWNKLVDFNDTRAVNATCAFTTWAWTQGKFAMIGHLQRNGLSKTMAGHKKVILEKLEFRFRNGPEYGKTWLDLARDHSEELANLTGLSQNMISNVLAAWSLVEVSDIEKGSETPHNVVHSRFSWAELEQVMSRLPSRSKTFLIQMYVSGLSIREITQKYNIAKPDKEREMTEENARKIVSEARKKLRDFLDEMDPGDNPVPDDNPVSDDNADPDDEMDQNGL